MLRISCSYFPQSGRHEARNFLAQNRLQFVQAVAQWLGEDSNESSLHTIVTPQADQRFSFGMAELSFDIIVGGKSATETSLGTDQLYNELLAMFPQLASIDVQITYMHGIYHRTHNVTRRGPRAR